jgi:hypothetical protein
VFSDTTLTSLTGDLLDVEAEKVAAENMKVRGRKGYFGSEQFCIEACCIEIGQAM